MIPKLNTRLRLDQPATYRIEVLGRLDPSWAGWLRAAELQVERGDDGGPVTILVVEVTDQAALYGCLSHLRDLGLPLLLVCYLPGTASEYAAGRERELNRTEE